MYYYGHVHDGGVGLIMLFSGSSHDEGVRSQGGIYGEERHFFYCNICNIMRGAVVTE